MRLALAKVLTDASRAHADAQDEIALLEALHRAENEGWKSLSPPIDHSALITRVMANQQP